MLVRIVWKLEGRRWIVCGPNEEIPIEIVAEGLNEAPELTSSTDDVRRCFPLLEQSPRLHEVDDRDVCKTRGKAWTTGGGGEVAAHALRERWVEFTVHPRNDRTEPSPDPESGASPTPTVRPPLRGAEIVRILLVPWPTRLLCLMMLSIIPAYTLIRLYRLFDTLQLTIGDLGPGLGGVLLVPLIGRLLNRMGSLVDDDNVLPWGGVGFRLYWTGTFVLVCLLAIEGVLHSMLQYRTVTLLNRTPAEIEMSGSTAGRFSLPPDRPMTRLDAAYSMCEWAEPNALCDDAIAAERHCDALIGCEQDPRSCDEACRGASHGPDDGALFGCPIDVKLVRKERAVLEEIEAIGEDDARVGGGYRWPSAARKVVCADASEKRRRCESPCDVLDELLGKARAEAQEACVGAGSCEDLEQLCRDSKNPSCNLVRDAERACICDEGERALMRRIVGIPPERIEVSCTRPTTFRDNLAFAWSSLGGFVAPHAEGARSPSMGAQAPFAASIVPFFRASERRGVSGRLCDDPGWGGSFLGSWFAQPPALTIQCEPGRWGAAEELLENSGGLERATEIPGRGDRDTSQGFDRGIRIARDHGARQILIEPSANCANVEKYQLEQLIDGLEIFVDETYRPTETSAPFVIETAMGDEIGKDADDEMAVIRTKFGSVYRFAPRTPEGRRHTLYEPQQGHLFEVAFYSAKDVRKGAQAPKAQLQCAPQGSMVALDYIEWYEDPSLGHAFHDIRISREIGSWSSTWSRTSTEFEGRAWFCRPPGAMKAVSAKVQLSAALPILLHLRARNLEADGAAATQVDLTLEFLWTTPGESGRPWGTLRCSYDREEGISIVPLGVPAGHLLRRLSFKAPGATSPQTWTSADNASLSGIVFACAPPAVAMSADETPPSEARAGGPPGVPAVAETSRGSRTAHVTFPAGATSTVVMTTLVPTRAEGSEDAGLKMSGQIEIDRTTCYWDPTRRTVVRPPPLPENCARSSKRADLQKFSRANPHMSCDVVVECDG